METVWYVYIQYYPFSEFKDNLAPENLWLPKVSPTGKKTHLPTSIHRGYKI